ncbi:uncharacterized protein YeaO (DUF488 family) [Bacillus pakistanensis]|uniref:Uncharacterized protein YeaO (DUF488 family) n=1 Tax=Rossellomorea pakistanensis TaxID=992288 RepID=A0ABS2NBD2_9BACI|nr:DUF488 family protein [Bacillus pakistanensis]MBM7585130.1 uncharacterized protein YeaO (DUF488 family) [Bacillus pakistanensis]
MPVYTKRAYEEISEDDGVRVLVDRMWPRGISKHELKIDYWMKQVAPSASLRKWFDHDPDKFHEFKDKYKSELKNDEDKKEQLEELKRIVKKNEKKVTLIYGAKDKKNNQATVLKEILDRQHV